MLRERTDSYEYGEERDNYAFHCICPAPGSLHYGGLPPCGQAKRLSLSTTCDTKGRTPAKYVMSYPAGVREGSYAFRFTDLPTGLASEPGAVGDDGDVF